MEISWLMTNRATFCSEAAHTVHGEFPVGCQRPFRCDEGGGFILYWWDSTASVQGMCFVRVEVTCREMWRQRVKPVVACLSHCLVLPPPVEMAAARTCTHVIRNTLISRLYSPSCWWITWAWEAPQQQSQGLAVLLKAISCLSLA